MGKDLECTSCDRASHVYITLGLHTCARAEIMYNHITIHGDTWRSGLLGNGPVEALP